jgi:natural product biosynthesis luciferase-like monooxygenase protein
MQFSLLFFSQRERERCADQYQLVTDCTTYCDARGFQAIWLPERHFHSLGGIFPSPAVLAASLAPLTTNIRLRAGSVILPLHHPAVVVEAWSVVDNLSHGRVDLAFASGWNVNDFVLSPAAYANLRREWIERIAVVKALWEGKAVEFPNGDGQLIAVSVHPRPIQPALSTWLAVSRRTDSFKLAGSMGMNVLTMLSGINLAQLHEKIAVYREARQKAGLDPTTGVITLMLHTYVHRDLQTVHKRVREPLLDYIRQSAITHLQGGAVSLGSEAGPHQINRLVEYSFQRYFNSGSLLGDVFTTKSMIIESRAAGVDEIACMLDFGLTREQILEGLPYLHQLHGECVDV